MLCAYCRPTKERAFLFFRNRRALIYARDDCKTYLGSNKVSETTSKRNTHTNDRALAAAAEANAAPVTISQPPIVHQACQWLTNAGFRFTTNEK